MSVTDVGVKGPVLSRDVIGRSATTVDFNNQVGEGDTHWPKPASPVLTVSRWSRRPEGGVKAAHHGAGRPCDPVQHKVDRGAQRVGVVRVDVGWLRLLLECEPREGVVCKTQFSIRANTARPIISAFERLGKGKSPGRERERLDRTDQAQPYRPDHTSASPNSPARPQGPSQTQPRRSA